MNATDLRTWFAQITLPRTIRLNSGELVQNPALYVSAQLVRATGKGLAANAALNHLMNLKTLLSEKEI